MSLSDWSTCALVFVVIGGQSSCAILALRGCGACYWTNVLLNLAPVLGFAYSAYSFSYNFGNGLQNALESSTTASSSSGDELSDKTAKRLATGMGCYVVCHDNPSRAAASGQYYNSNSLPKTKPRRVPFTRRRVPRGAVQVATGDGENGEESGSGSSSDGEAAAVRRRARVSRSSTSSGSEEDEEFGRGRGGREETSLSDWSTFALVIVCLTGHAPCAVLALRGCSKAFWCDILFIVGPSIFLAIFAATAGLGSFMSGGLDDSSSTTSSKLETRATDEEELTKTAGTLLFAGMCVTLLAAASMLGSVVLGIYIVCKDNPSARASYGYDLSEAEWFV
ncbi:hypothetical protein JCM10207_003548 [Rhodosporidiobolus poonsookiae]